ncbi:tetratricopeptide repeat protein, partial [Kitasatospora sp. NPDC059088]|uniref:tetratricopeptide repeat protein n=1 Tax=Kitasatospora sp. NPDC059088 TaxID=3346722 RepID=UPI003675F2D8
RAPPHLGPLVRLEELAEACAESRGPRSPLTLEVRQGLAHARLRAGDADGAVRVYERIVADRLPAGGAAPTAALLAGHASADDVAVSLGALRTGPVPVTPSLAVGLAAALAADGRRDTARELLAAVCVGREALMDPGHPLAAEARAALTGLDRAERVPLGAVAGAPVPGAPVPGAPAQAGLGRGAPQLLPRRSRGSVHRAVDPPAPRPAWRPRLTLVEDPAVGVTTHLEFHLEPADGSVPAALPELRLVAAVSPEAVLDPPVTDHVPAGAPARFALTPAVAGPHTVRITVFDRGHGAVLQDLSAVLDVPAESPAEAGAAVPAEPEDQEQE